MPRTRKPEASQKGLSRIVGTVPVNAEPLAGIAPEVTRAIVHASHNSFDRLQRDERKRRQKAFTQERENRIKAVGCVVEALFDSRTAQAVTKRLTEFLRGVPMPAQKEDSGADD